MSYEVLVADAFEHLGIPTLEVHGRGADAGVDVIVDPDGADVRLQVKHRSLLDAATASRLLNQYLGQASEGRRDPVLFIVGDRITDAARTLLVRHEAGYLDLRGQLALRSGQMVVNAAVPPIKKRAEQEDALSGRAGLEVAVALLTKPGRPRSVRKLATELDRSASTVSTILARLRRSELLNDDNTVAGTDLFWRLAERWPRKRTRLTRLPRPGEGSTVKALRIDIDNLENEGWAMTDSAAAVAYGAPLAFRADQTLDFFVPDASVLRRATTLLGEAEPRQRAELTVRVAPVPAAVERRVHLDTSVEVWPLAEPLFVALDLAQDAGRGREVLDAWTPPREWARVW
jgi:hypothetical protein